MAHDFADDELVVEIDGQGVQPETIPTVAALEFAASLLALVARAGEQGALDVRLLGLRVVGKCVAIVARAENPDVTRSAAAAALDALRLGSAQRGMVDAMKRVREAQHGLHPYTTRLSLGAWSAPIVAPMPAELYAPRAIEVFRARPVRVGGARPLVRLQPLDGDDAPFTVQATPELARGIGGHLYEEVEVTAEIVRYEDGRVESDSGTLLAFEALDDGDPLTLWRAWYRAHASSWDDVDDIEEALGRE